MEILHLDCALFREERAMYTMWNSEM